MRGSFIETEATAGSVIKCWLCKTLEPLVEEVSVERTEELPGANELTIRGLVEVYDG